MSGAKLHLLDAMHHTPFADEKFFERFGMVVVDDPKAADVLVSRWLREFTEERMALGKPAIVWTHEPSFATMTSSIVRDHLGFADVHVFNVYNRNIYTDNFYYAPRKAISPVTGATFDRATFNAKRVAVFARYLMRPLIVGGVDVSIYGFRSQLALDLNQMGICDIRGKEWPDGVALGESRDEGRVEAKIGALSEYPFSLCCENTLFDFYVTEKPWEAIRGYSLPIYLPNKTFGQDFPAGSFIDLSQPEFANAEKLFARLKEMSEGEYISRLNACIEVYNRAAKEKRFSAARRRAEELVVASIDDLRLE